jgi:hypothetical protein
MPLALIVVALAAAPKLEPTKKVLLLGGRVSIQLAATAKDNPRPPEDIMSPEQSVEAETRVMTELPGGRLVFFIEEEHLLAPASDDPLVKLQSEAKPDAHPVIESAGDIKIVRQAPTQWSAIIQDGELVESALIVLPDKTLVRASFFVSPGVKDKSKLRAFAVAALKTLQYVAPLKTGGGVRVGNISVTLPKGWVHVEQRGPDFNVHRFMTLPAMGDEAPQPIVGLYEGGHPGWISKQAGAKEPVKEEAGTWLGETTTWHVSGNLHEAMAGAELDRYHVWYSGSGAKAVVDAMKLATK